MYQPFDWSDSRPCTTSVALLVLALQRADNKHYPPWLFKFSNGLNAYKKYRLHTAFLPEVSYNTGFFSLTDAINTAYVRRMVFNFQSILTLIPGASGTRALFIIRFFPQVVQGKSFVSIPEAAFGWLFRLNE